MSNSKLLVTTRGTSDAYEDELYILVTSQGPYLKDGSVVGATEEELLTVAKKYRMVSDDATLETLSSRERYILTEESGKLAFFYFSVYCQSHNELYLIQPDCFEEVEEQFPNRLLGEEEFLQWWLTSKLDFSDKFWQEPIHKELYLKAAYEEVDPFNAEEYVALYDLLGRDVGVKLFWKITGTLDGLGLPSLMEADKEANNEVWQVIASVLEQDARINAIVGLRAFISKELAILKTEKNADHYIKLWTQTLETCKNLTEESNWSIRVSVYDSFSGWNGEVISASVDELNLKFSSADMVACYSCQVSYDELEPYDVTMTLKHGDIAELSIQIKEKENGK